MGAPGWSCYYYPDRKRKKKKTHRKKKEAHDVESGNNNNNSRASRADIPRSLMSAVINSAQLVKPHVNASCVHCQRGWKQKQWICPTWKPFLKLWCFYSFFIFQDVLNRFVVPLALIVQCLWLFAPSSAYGISPIGFPIVCSFRRPEITRPAAVTLEIGLWRSREVWKVITTCSVEQNPAPLLNHSDQLQTFVLWQGQRCERYQEFKGRWLSLRIKGALLSIM